MTAETPELFVLYGEWRRLEKVAIANGDDDAPWQAAFEAEGRFYDMPAKKQEAFRRHVCLMGKVSGLVGKLTNRMSEGGAG